jgi:hypothetical protein
MPVKKTAYLCFPYHIKTVKQHNVSECIHFSVCFSVKFAVCRDYANTRANLFIIPSAEKINIKILPLQNGHWAILQDVNVAGRGVDHQLPSSANISNESCFSPNLSLCLVYHSTCRNFRVSKIFLSLALDEEENWSIRDIALSSLSLFDDLLESGRPIISQCVLNDDETYTFLKPVVIIIYRTVSD